MKEPETTKYDFGGDIIWDTEHDGKNSPHNILGEFFLRIKNIVYPAEKMIYSLTEQKELLFKIISKEICNKFLPFIIARSEPNLGKIADSMGDVEINTNSSIEIHCKTNNTVENNELTIDADFNIRAKITSNIETHPLVAMIIARDTIGAHMTQSLIESLRDKYNLPKSKICFIKPKINNEEIIFEMVKDIRTKSNN